MVLEHEFLKYLSVDNTCILEQKPMFDVAIDNQLMIYKHNGFWQCMDTQREHEKLEELWKNGAPWKVWDDKVREFKPAIRDRKLKINKEIVI